jgi:hypothetical protein
MRENKISEWKKKENNESSFNYSEKFIAK